MNRDNKSLNGITQHIIGCAYRVSNTLGCRFLEKVYENALAHELRKAGLAVEQQCGIQVHDAGIVVGDYVADLSVENCILVELKTVQAINEMHMAPCMNYLKATGLHICRLMNFAKPKQEIRRVVLRLDETAHKRRWTQIE
jgi:GxxExxY protein